MKGFRFGRAFCGVLAAFLLVLGGLILPAVAEAEFQGTQDERYPQVIPADYIEALARERLEKTLEEQGETRRYTIMLSRKVQSMRCPEGTLVCETELPKDLRYGGLNPVYVKVYVNGALYRRSICYYELHVYGQMLVAARDLRPEQLLTAADVRFEEHEVENRSEFYLEDPALVVGRVPNRVIRSGSPITDGILQNPVVIDNGAPVQLVANYNGVKITTEGVALQKGRVGNIIRVRNATSSKILRGRVIDATTVEIL
ncbi:MAG: flagellar basal body P-ring formation protein FlgA [Selenomonadaceae bacterium]|nr:flagellar basal body P-ring formation protein FlgA [Selenomonadaceae bacterium]